MGRNVPWAPNRLLSIPYAGVLLRHWFYFWKQKKTWIYKVPCHLKYFILEKRHLLIVFTNGTYVIQTLQHDANVLIELIWHWRYLPTM